VRCLPRTIFFCRFLILTSFLAQLTLWLPAGFGEATPQKQNDRKGEVPALARDRITEWLRLEGTSGDHLIWCPCSKQGQLEQVAQSHVQLGFEYLQGWGLHNISQQPFPVSEHLHSLIFKWDFLYFSLCPLPLVFSLGTSEKSLALPLLPPIGYLYTLIRSPLRLFLTMLSNPSSLSLSSYGRCSSPFSGLTPVCPCLYCARVPSTGPVL